MLKFVLRKLAQGMAMVIIVSAIAFALLSAAGGDALSSLADNPQVSAETIERLRTSYGLDRPVAARYASWLGNFLLGDMGESFFFKMPVSELVLARLANTASAGALALFLALAAAMSLAFLAVRFPGRGIGRLCDGVILFTASTPRIVLSLVALLFIVYLARGGRGLAPQSPGLMVLSSVVLALPLIAVFLNQAKGELARAMQEPFVQFARAKGLSETRVIIGHALRAALNPVLSLFGLALGSILGGSVIVETVLGWQGIGALMVAAVRGRDVPLVMGIVVVASVAVWLGNAIAEFLQMVNDKRLREAELR